MTWKAMVDSSVASGRWSKRGGVLARALFDFRDVLEAGSVSGVDMLSFSALTSGDKLDPLEGGFDSLGDVEALCLSFFRTGPLCLIRLCTLAATVAPFARSCLSILQDVAPSTAQRIEGRFGRRVGFEGRTVADYEGIGMISIVLAQAMEVLEHRRR